MTSAWRERYDLALKVTKAAGEHALRYFDADVTVEWKQDDSPVTVADRETEQLLRTQLLSLFPDDGFLGEEFGEKPGTSGYRWIIDPIDGTRNFVRNIPIWATLVGLEYQGDPIAGVVAVPALGQLFHALRGDGAYRDGRKLRVSAVNTLEQSTWFYTSLAWFSRVGHQDTFLELVRRGQTSRGFGDFYGHLLVAQGSGEFMLEHGVHIWDVAALFPIIEEAGGRCTDWQGKRTMATPDVLLSNGLLHDQVLRIVHDVDDKSRFLGERRGVSPPVIAPIA